MRKLRDYLARLDPAYRLNAVKRRLACSAEQDPRLVEFVKRAEDGEDLLGLLDALLAEPEAVTPEG